MEISLFVTFLSLLFLPVCQSLNLAYVLKEDTGQGDYVGNIPQELNFPILEPNQVQRTYQVLTGGDKIHVDPNTGDLNTAIRLDREKLCPENPPTCTIDVEVAVLPSDYFQLIKVQFTLEDLNDNTPTFPSPIIVKDISESAFVGTLIRLDSATDPDLGANSIDHYDLTSTDVSSDESPLSYFELLVVENIDGTKIPQLQLVKQLDREVISSYELQLKAIDGGTPSLTGTATIKINVSDSNDNQPIFAESRYIVEVPENRPAGFVVVRVEATDLDSGSNADLSYTFPGVVSAQDKAIFQLNPDTGAISIKAPGLDYENRTIHHLTVEARDKGPNSSPAYTTVTVKVIDINDEYPQFSIKFMEYLDPASQDRRPTSDAATETPDTEVVFVKEDMARGSYIAFVTITDRDTGLNGNVSCRLKESDGFELFVIDRKDNRYLIKTKKELDRETQPSYNLEIDAWDFGNPSLTNSTTIAIELEDVNDNPPKFRRGGYRVNVKETINGGDRVTQVEAADPDDGLNARVNYTIWPTNTSQTLPFVIEPLTGIVRFATNAEPLDAENSTGPFILTVTATDNGIPSHSATTSLTITVLDENDNSPKFSKSQYSFPVKEHLKRGAYVGHVFATDRDINKDTNAKVSYSFVDSDENIPFFINHVTGMITYDGEQSELDREVLQSQPYLLRVEARDSGDRPRKDYATVQIFLTDINDNSPSISYPNVTRDVAFIYFKDGWKRKSPSTPASTNLSLFTSARESLLIGDSSSKAVHPPRTQPVVITRVVATDPDEQENGRVHYAIAAGNVYDYFTINMNSGEVSLNLKQKKSFKKMKRGCHVIEILVSDMGKPKALSTTAWVNIYVTDKRPRKMNVTKALKSCMNNTFYPILHTPSTDIGKAGADDLALILIICFSALLLIMLIIMIVMLVKYKCCCCSKSKMSRSYNCQKANNIYNDDIFQRRMSIDKQAGSQSSLAQPNWSNMQHQMEESDPLHDKNIHGQEDLSEGSVVSQYSGKDSGTGDSMPSEAHNTGYRVPYGARNAQPNYISHPANKSYSSHTGNMVTEKPLYGMGNPPLHSRSANSFSSRCTNDCHIHGHGDNCWMPDTEYVEGIHYADHGMSGFICPMHGEGCSTKEYCEMNQGYMVQDNNLHMHGQDYMMPNNMYHMGDGLNDPSYPMHPGMHMGYDLGPNRPLQTFNPDHMSVEKAYVNLQKRGSMVNPADEPKLGYAAHPQHYEHPMYVDNCDDINNTKLIHGHEDVGYNMEHQLPPHSMPQQYGNRVNLSDDGYKPNDGLTMIKEELDAEDVVAEIDDLLQ
uniref:protocadherin-11 X-linked n=1 Tax=Ciona intestinalis TaxID=7719 RepID=UPI000180C6A0|nr:protocadherin-11 X-linked [Ciona intestinalis]|eukprot:XP_002121500.1 protocadherin-11 X-linked [Ciona intestinalis]